MDRFLQTALNFQNGQSYEKCDLSYRVLKDLDFSIIGPISFFRSDFRGSKFSSITFCRNNFDLADFIGNTFMNVEFREINWGNSEVKNCYFTKCQFFSNSYNDSAIHNTTFEKCIFENETFRFTMFDCEFHNCQFINCTFDQCTTDSLVFSGCQIIKTEMSTMHAENFKFSNCIIRDTYLGSCFMGTYLFKNVDMNLLSFKYRGEIQSIHSNFFDELIDTFLIQKRYFEYLNLLLLCRNTSEFSKVFRTLFPLILEESNPNTRNYNIKNSIEMLIFYYNSELLPFSSLLEIMAFLQALDQNATIIPYDSVLVFREAVFKLNNTISEAAFDSDYLVSIPDSKCCRVIVHCADTSFQQAEERINRIFEIANQKLNNHYEVPYFEIVEEKKGSVILTISSALLLSLMAAKVVKSIFGIFCDMRITSAKTKKEVELIENSKSVTSLRKITQVDKTREQDEKQILELNEVFGKDYIINLLVEYIL